MVKKIGLVGISEGNGHPYSYSVIMNGFHEQHFKKSGWDVIYKYVKKRDISEIGFDNSEITHIWTQDLEISTSIAKSCKIEHIVEDYKDMIGHVDAVLIARDDYENHLLMAKPFLEAGLKVFIDKPLTVDEEELNYYKPFLLSGQLMSFSGMRYAIELDDIRSNLAEFGKLKCIQSTVINDWNKYGIHLIDAVLGLIPFEPKSIEYIQGSEGIFVILFENGLAWTITTLEEVPKTFNINIWGSNKRESIEVNDNFSMFRRLLWRFVKLVETNEMHYEPRDTLLAICLLIAGNISRKERRIVYLDEFKESLK
ncbi:Gfo/Idh/MocA family protein [Psychrobacillus psychrodurans]|uniref:Gfo/Idh/MocA family protein n=1 Tax=Psychrobacillus psychrodurans TaxID=126157 RepID=UPI003CFF4A38